MILKNIEPKNYVVVITIAEVIVVVLEKEEGTIMVVLVETPVVATEIEVVAHSFVAVVAC